MFWQKGKYELLTTSQESRLSDDDFDVQLYKIDEVQNKTDEVSVELTTLI